MGDFLQDSCSKPLLHELKYACESVPSLLKLRATDLKLYFSKILIIQSA